MRRALLAISAFVAAAGVVEGVLRVCACAFLPLAIPSTAGWAPFPDRASGHFGFRYNSRGDRTSEPGVARGAPPWCMVGDSHTNGIGVDDSSRFSNRLERLLSASGRPVAIFNVASPGTTLPHYVAMIQRCRTIYAAHTIVAVVDLGNDLIELAHWIDYGRPDVTKRPARSWTEPIIAPLRRSYLFDAVAFQWGRMQHPRPRPARYGNALQADYQADFYRARPGRLPADLAVLSSELQEMSSAAGASRLLVVAFPSWLQVDDKSGPQDEFEVTLEGKILDRVKQSGLEYLDVTSALAADRRARKYWPVDRHLNDAGHAVLADAILRAARDY